MDFNKVYGRIRDIDQGKKQQITESKKHLSECGEMMEPYKAPVSMSVNMNASGVDQIKELMGLINGAQATRMSDAMPMPSPGMPIGAPAMDLKSSDAVDPSDILRLAGVMAKPAADEEITDDIEDSYKASTEPDVTVQDTDYMIKDLAGGLNKEKRMSKHSYKQGDNPMAMETIKQDLMSQYKQMKGR